MRFFRMVLVNDVGCCWRPSLFGYAINSQEGLYLVNRVLLGTVLMFVVMVARPQGIWPRRRRPESVPTKRRD
ncbi:hypothetical protein [Marinobacter sp. V034]|uniref:hypothetical protein n=1 Tax=Marinobacter sp. V034 TaxID=3459610 RepID=UPI004044E2E8